MIRLPDRPVQPTAAIRLGLSHNAVRAEAQGGKKAPLPHLPTIAAIGTEGELLRNGNDLAFGWSERENSVAQRSRYEASAGSSLRRESDGTAGLERRTLLLPLLPNQR